MQEVIRDRRPADQVYLGLYREDSWASFTGTTHTRDRISVAMPNDAGDWETMDAGACNMNICDPQARQVDWGVTRYTFGKMRRSYKTRIFCMDQLRHFEEVAQFMDGIWKGLSKVPDFVMSSWLKYQSILGSDKIYICGSSKTTVTTTSAMFANGLDTINLTSDSNLPTSKLQMTYLESLNSTLQLNGYWGDGNYMPAGKMKLITDQQSALDLCNGNPALALMYAAADFEKGGKFYQYGAMLGCGNYLMQIDPFPARFIRVSTGLLKRIWPYQNVAATVGLKNQLDPAYVNAPYQLSHIPHRDARVIYVGDISPIHPEMKFGSRDLHGKWQWINDAYLQAFDPSTGTSCSMDNPRRNKGYWLADFEFGAETQRPELEAMILHLSENQTVADVPRAAAVTYPTPISGGLSSGQYQALLPYNSFCDVYPEES